MDEQLKAMKEEICAKRDVEMARIGWEDTLTKRAFLI